jgi:hypothetical protein
MTVITGSGTILDFIVGAVGIPIIPLIMAGMAAYSAYKGSKQKSQSKQSSTQSSSSTPTLAPEYSGLQKTLIPMIQQRLINPQGLPPGLEQANIRNINKTYDLAEQGLGNNLAARGMSRAGMAGAAEGRLAGGRASDIVQMQGTLPLIGRQMQNEDAGMAMQLMNMGRGMNTTGTYSGTGESSSQAGGGAGAVAGSLANSLGWMYGSGMLGGGGGGGGLNNSMTPSSLPYSQFPSGTGPGTFPGWAQSPLTSNPSFGSAYPRLMPSVPSGWNYNR